MRTVTHTAKVLVIDDNAIARKFLRAILEAEGYAVAEASDGVEALALMEGEAIDAVISDVLRPGERCRGQDEWRL